MGKVMLLSGLICIAAILAAGASAPRQESKSTAEEPKTQESPSKDRSSDEARTAEEVLEEIISRRPQRPLIAPEDASPDSRAGATRLAKWPEGFQLVSRLGRIVQEGQGWVFVFESDHPDHAEPPVKLLPNQKLESMVRETRAAVNSPVFILSGEVFVYFGENYLLPRLALRKPQSGNLSK